LFIDDFGSKLVQYAYDEPNQLNVNYLSIGLLNC